MSEVATTTSLLLPGGAPPDSWSLLSLGLFTLVAVFLIGLLLVLARVLGNRTNSTMKDEPYECGVQPTGTARLRDPVPFYLVAIFFIVFDVEAVFIVSWAVAYDLLGWRGFLQIAFFIIILFLALVYLWRMGGIDWGPSRLKIRRGDNV